MPNAAPENAPSATATEGIKALSELCEAEYGPNLQELMEDPSSTVEQSLLRIGRLMGVTLKQPFSEFHSLDPTDPKQTRTGALRGWEVRPEFHELGDFRLLNEYPALSSTWQYDVLNRLRGEEGYDSVPELMDAMKYERRFFSALANSFRKHVCSDTNLRKQLNEAAGSTTTIATHLVQALPLLIIASPILGGFVLIVQKYGIDRFCAWIDGYNAERVEE